VSTENRLAELKPTAIVKSTTNQNSTYGNVLSITAIIKTTSGSYIEMQSCEHFRHLHPKRNIDSITVVTASIVVSCNKVFCANG